ncbi:TL20.3 [Symbiodinium necroappetens]|uniref:TL20.3 protein n=1 Tax=Symbiodinium necroappetens TaxID=1628268 RepID=A0A812MD75_9DINO|nr:TL20.3 [Symbiodinium necroappetens]
MYTHAESQLCRLLSARLGSGPLWRLFVAEGCRYRLGSTLRTGKGSAHRRNMRRSRIGTAAAVAVALVTLRSLAFLGTQPSQTAGPSRRHLMTSGGILGAMALEAWMPSPAEALGSRDRRVAYPPINKQDPRRCEWKTSQIAQASAQRDKLYDLRECNLAGTSAADNDVSGALMNKGDFSKVNFENAQLTKVVAAEANFEGANFKNSVADRMDLTKANLKNAIFKNAMLTTSSFEEANVEGADFTDAFLDSQSVRVLCTNPTMKGTNPVTGADTFLSAGYGNYMGGAVGTMQTASLPTQAVGTNSGAAFQRTAFSGNTAAMATQNVADVGQFKTMTPDALKTQPAGAFTNYDAMATRPPQSYGGCGTQNFSGYGGYSQGYAGQGYGAGAQATGAAGSYGQGCGQAYQGYGGYAGAGYGAPDQTYGNAYGPGYGGTGYGGGQGGQGGCGYGYGPSGYGQGAGYGYDARGYNGLQDAAATQQLSAQQVYNKDVSGSFVRGGGMYGGAPGYNAYAGYPAGAGGGQVAMGRKPRARRSVCC